MFRKDILLIKKRDRKKYINRYVENVQTFLLMRRALNRDFDSGSDSDLDIDEDRLFYRRGRKLQEYQVYSFPRKSHELITGLYEASTEELIAIISRIQTKAHVKEIVNDLNNIELDKGIEGEIGIQKQLEQKICQRLQQCLQFLSQKRVQEDDLSQCKFREGLYLLLKYGKLPVRKNFKISQQIWKILKETDSLKSFCSYIQLLSESLEQQILYKKRKEQNNEDQIITQIKTEMIKIVENQNGFESINIRIWHSSNPFTTQQRLILRLRALQMLNNLQISKQPTEIQQTLKLEVQQFIKNENCLALIQEILKIGRNVQFCREIMQSFISCQLDQTGKSLRNDKVNQLLLSEENMKLAMTDRILPGLFQQKYIRITADAIHSKFSIAILKVIDNQAVTGRTIDELRVLVGKLIDDQSRPLFCFGKPQNIVAFTCQIFNILASVVTVGRTPNAGQEKKLCYNEKFVDIITKTMLSWASKSETKQYVYNIFDGITKYVYLQTEKNISKQSAIKQKLINFFIELIEKFKKIPADWPTVKRSRLIIETWTTLGAQHSAKASRLMSILLNTFFSSECKISIGVVGKFTGVAKPKQQYCDVFSRYVLEEVYKFEQRIETKENFDFDPEFVLNCNIFIFKLHLVITGKFELKTSNEIAQIMHKFYVKYAHVIDKLFHLRAWINHHYKPSSLTEIAQGTKIVIQNLQKINFFREANLIAFECLLKELPNNYEDKNKQDKMFRQFIESMNTLQNNLDLKTTSMIIPKQTYEELVQGILRPLCSLGTNLYNKIVDEIIESEEKAQRMNIILTKNYISQKKSIYSAISTIFFNLKMALRLYLNNIGYVVTYNEAYDLIMVCGKLWDDILLENLNQKRSAVELLVDLFSADRWKKMSRLTYVQTLYQSSAYQSILSINQKVILNKKESLSLVLLIPLWESVQLKANYYLKQFSQMFENEKFVEASFNHQIAFENELKRCIKYRKFYNTARKNTLNKRSHQLFDIFFLPTVQTSTAQIGCKFSLYLKQIQTLFQNQICSNFAKIHIGKVVFKLYDKNVVNNNEDQQAAIEFIQRLKLQQVSSESFKQKTQEILKKFVAKFIEETYSSGKNAYYASSIFSLLEKINQTQNVNPQENILNPEEFLWLLITKGFEKFNVHYQNSKQNPCINKETQSSIEIKQIMDHTDRLMAKNERLNIIYEQKMSQRQSPAYMFLKSLSLVKKNNKDLVKKTFALGIQIKLLQYLSYTRKKKELQIIGKFILETLPEFTKLANKDEKITIIIYYKKVLESMADITGDDEEAIETMLRVISAVSLLHEDGFASQAQLITKKVQNICTSKLCEEELSKSSKFLALLSRSMKIQPNFFEIYVEHKIKSYILQTYETRIKQIQKNDENSINYRNEPDYIEIGVEDYLKTFKVEKNINSTLFNKITREIFVGWRSITKLVYTNGLNALTQSNLTGQKFISYIPSSSISYITKKITQFYTSSAQKITNSRKQLKIKLESANQQDQKQKILKQFSKQNEKITQTWRKSKQHFKRFLQDYQILHPMIILQKIAVKGKQHKIKFIDWIIESLFSDAQDDKIDILIILLHQNGLVIDFNKSKSFNQYISAIVLQKCLTQIRLPNNQRKFDLNKVIYLTSACLCVQQFNDLALTKGSPSLLQEIQKLYLEKKVVSMRNLDENPENLKVSTFLYQECLYLIYKHIQVSKALKQNQIFDSRRNSQFINFDLFFEEISPQQFKKSVNPQQFNSFNREKWYRSLHNIIQDIEKLVSKTLNQQKKQVEQISMSNEQEKTEMKIINLEKLANAYKPHENSFIDTTRKIDMFHSPRFKGYCKKLKQICNINKIQQEKERFRRSSDNSSDSDRDQFIHYLIRRQTRGHPQEINDIIRLHRGERQNQAINQTNEVNFIQQLAQIRPNSQIVSQTPSPNKQDKLNIQNKQEEKKQQIKERKEDRQTNLMVQMPTDSQQLQNTMPIVMRKKSSIKMSKIRKQFSETEKKLLQNTNYKKYAESNTFQQMNMLLSMSSEFLEGLPSEVYMDFKMKSNALKEQKRRQQYEKNRTRGGMDPRRNRRNRNIEKQKQKLKNKFRNNSFTSQVTPCTQIIVNSLRGLLTNSTNSSTIDHNICSLFLELKNSNIKEKVLTTLIVMLKNQKKLKIQFFRKNEKQGWKHDIERARRKQKSSLSSIFNEKILTIIKNSIDNCLFDNSELFQKRLDFKQFYGDVFLDQLVLGEEISLDFSVELGADERYYDPLFELLLKSLEARHSLARILLKYLKNPPNILIQKIFFLMKDGRIEPGAYKSMQLLSKNQKLKQLFEKQYTKENPPSYELLGKIIMYDFGKLNFVKDLHKNALKHYKISHNKFLCQIFALYTDEELEQQQDMIIEYRSIYSKIVIDLYEAGERIIDLPISRLFKLNKFLDFNAKVSYFYNSEEVSRVQFYDFEDPFSVNVRVDPSDVFYSTYLKIMSLTPRQIRRKITIDYMGLQDGFGDGYFRVWLGELKDFMREFGMFIPVQFENVYQPTPEAVLQDQNYLNLFKFLGRIIGIAVLHRKQFPLTFSSIFFKILLGKKLSLEDLNSVNPNLFLDLKMYQKNINLSKQKFEDLGLERYFKYEGRDIRGQKIQVLLKEGGENILVTQQNFQEYKELITKQVVTDFCTREYEKIKEGFYQIIPVNTIQIFSQEELEQLISGVSTIDRKEFEQTTTYQGYSKDDKVIRWFWEIINEFNDDDLIRVFQFITGTSRLPFGGFKALSHRIKITRIEDATRIPQVHNCWNELDLPCYATKQALKVKLLISILQGK